jgi:hypothetical protein
MVRRGKFFALPPGHLEKRIDLQAADATPRKNGEDRRRKNGREFRS